MKITNDHVYEAIKKSIINDVQIAYEVFKEEGYDNLEGVILCLNSFSKFSIYLKENPVKLADFTECLFTSFDFIVQLSFVKDGEDEFYPLVNEK